MEYSIKSGSLFIAMTFVRSVTTVLRKWRCRSISGVIIYARLPTHDGGFRTTCIVAIMFYI